ncbi:MAG: hypothetical protein FWG87_11685 [Defluviitaleaceae bacterium]|nr:hypothetical protein [Defluviitaleaceae bacterium]
MSRQTHERRFFVGDGFIRPEITSLCFGRRAVLSKKTTYTTPYCLLNGRCPSPN